ncbi:cation:proton antiporter [Thauera sp.]|uniref:cation:proton antiporter n=1 Tax=Thauera sp. TaxID=1905334 RepID=UPI002BD2DC96|nr:cation:proton antiporter [Thauera sp.]HRP23461.1 cation:proton antiporter [Thauera sp.]
MSNYLPIEDPVLVFALVAFLILLAPIVMGRWRLPGTIGLLLAGAILGPNALGVLARDQSFVLFGTVGLLYIMFSAALEIDLVVLKRYRVHSLVFGLLTFAIPQGIGTLLGYYVLGFPLPAAILLASLFASHTLLAYPVTRQLGIARNQAVTTAVGGTIITDTLALLVLAVIAASTQGDAGDYFWHTLVGSLIVYIAAMLYGLPKLGRWFFRKVERNGVSEFAFVLSTVFGCASLAHFAGSEPIIGAFLAGLALNRLIPHSSVLMNRIHFTGEAIFIPFFLLSVGMLLDVRVFFADARALLIMLTMVACVMLTKWLAAEATRFLLGYSRDQARLVFGLSVAQAAATLAATIVGYDLGLFDDAVVNGAIMMMLVTCVIAPWQVDHYGRKVARRATLSDDAEVGSKQRILVSLSERAPQQALLDLAVMLREPDQQQPVFPLTVVEDREGANEQVAAAERVLSRATSHLSAADVSSQPTTRIDLNLAAGILKARRELSGTDVIIGWSERTTTPEFFFGSLLENMLSDRDYNLIVSRPRAPLSTCSRLLVAIPPDAQHEPGFPIAIRLIKRLARQLDGTLVILTESAHEAAIVKRIKGIAPQCEVRSVGLARWSHLVRTIKESGGSGDALVLYGARPGGLAWRPAMGLLPGRLASIFPEMNMLLIYPATPRDEQGDDVAIGSPAPTSMDFGEPRGRLPA